MTLKDSLIRALGPDKLASSPVMREMYAFDSSPFIHKPDWVVFPGSASDVAAVLKIASRFKTPVMARGAGTCLSGGAVPVKGGISLVMTRMNTVLAIDKINRTALVEPGVVNLNLQKVLAPHGLIFPPDPASQKVATIGGNVAECAGGIQGARYGVTKNYVLGLELVLSDGTITTTGLLSEQETLGPDLTGIFNGSEGSFAIITKVLVRLLPGAESVRTALVSFGRLEDAGQAVSAIIKQGIIPTALELMDQTMLRAVDDFTGIGFPKDAEAVLLMEVDGYDLDLSPQMDLMVEICNTYHAQKIQRAANAREREDLWKARRSGNGALGRIRPAYMVHDVTVPRNQVAQLLVRIREIGEKFNIIIAQMAHAGDGNAHPHLLYYPDEKNISQRLHDATQEIFRAALDLKGTISGEHGIGLEKQPFMGMQFSRSDLDFMKKIKAALDPDDMMNPGKIFPSREDQNKNRFAPPSGPEQKSGNPGNFILEFIPDNLSLKVLGTTPLKLVQETAARINACLPLCTHTQGDMTMAQLVGMGAKGHQALLTGSLKEFIFGLEFTTPAGEWVTTGGHTAKNVAGYDFTRLLWKSRENLGKIQTITLKLMPCPEKERLIVQQFSCLKTCMDLAKKIFQTHTCLCTLKVIGEDAPGSVKKKNWQLVAGLMGSTLLVENHTRQLLDLMDQQINNIQIWEPIQAKAFWEEDRVRKKRYPLPLLKGAGLRNALFSIVAQKARAFETLENTRIELDLGCAELTITAALSPFGPAVDLTFLENNAHGPDPRVPDFYMGKPDVLPQSLVYKRISQCLAPKQAMVQGKAPCPK